MGDTATTAHDLIRALAQYPPNTPVVALRSGSRREMRIVNVHRPSPHEIRRGASDLVVVLLDWAPEAD
jgi:hypothetical protein